MYATFSSRKRSECRGSDYPQCVAKRSQIMDPTSVSLRQLVKLEYILVYIFRIAFEQCVANRRMLELRHKVQFF